MRKFVSLAVAGLLSLSLLSGCGGSQPAKSSAPAAPAVSSAPASSAPAAKAWAPEKEVSFLVPSAAGGGSDINARTISEIVRKNNLSPKNIMVEIKSGGNGQVAYAEAVKRKGDNNTLVVLHSGQIVSAVLSKSPVQAKDMTMIATVALDEQTVVGKKGGKFANVKDLIEAGKKEGVKIGGSNLNSGDQLAVLMLNKYLGTKFQYVQFASAGEIMSALLGGHVDAGIFNPAEANSQIAGGEAVPLAVYSEKRLGGVFKDAPTFVELGYKDVKLNEIRAVSGPPNMAPEAIKFYQDVLKKVTETPEWQNDYIAKGFLTNQFLNSEDTTKIMDNYVKTTLELFKDVKQ